MEEVQNKSNGNARARKTKATKVDRGAVSQCSAKRTDDGTNESREKNSLF